MLKKLLIYGVLAFAAYQGLSFYTMYTLTEKASTCGFQSGFWQGAENVELTREKLLLSTRAWRCMKREQNFLEALFFKIPDAWINPSHQYVDPPFTPQELAGDVGVDQNVSEDLTALAEIYEGERERFMKIMDLLVASDKTKLGTQEISQRYGAVSAELRLIAARFSRLHPKTRQVDDLHQTFTQSLNQIASDGQALERLFTSVNQDLGEAETILVLPKSAIAENKNQLLNIQDRLTRAEVKIQNKLEAVKQHEKNAMEALDGLEALARKHGASLRFSA